MATSNDQQPTKSKQNAPVEFPDPDVRDYLPFYKELLDKISHLRGFTRTRARILEGDNLWDNTKAELEAAELMEPWKFNLYQSVLSALPAIAIAWLLGILFAPEPARASTEFLHQVTEWVERILPVIIPLTIPLMLAITSYSAAIGSLPRDVRTPITKARARRTYLYLDGAYGFWPQMLVAFSGSRLFTLLHVPDVLMFALTFVGYVWTLKVTMVRVPDRMFEANGWPDRYWPYVGWVTVFAPVAVAAVAVLILLAVGILATIAAIVQTWSCETYGIGCSL